MPTFSRGALPTRLGGIGHSERDMADYASNRISTIVHEIEFGTMGGDWFTGVMFASTWGVNGAPSLPKTITKANGGLLNNENINAMAVRYGLISADGATKTLVFTVYGRNIFNAPVQETVRFVAVAPSIGTGTFINGTIPLAFIDQIVVTSASGINALDVFLIGPNMGDAGQPASGTADVNPVFALPTRIKDANDLVSVKAYVYGNLAVVGYFKGQAAAGAPTAWQIGTPVYQVVGGVGAGGINSATARGMLVGVHETDFSGLNTHTGRILIQEVTGFFKGADNVDSDLIQFTGNPGAEVLKARGTLTFPDPGVPASGGTILQSSVWHKAIDFLRFPSYITVDPGKGSIKLSNPGGVSSPDPFGWQQLHWRYRIEIKCWSSVGVRSKKR